ncbi:MAG: hypothetical protein GY845_16480 [Planctomycetes bacterium]|nr:hypothetical protein [Planctomycetota bacterium]
MATDKSDTIKKDYDAKKASVERLRSALVEQIKELISQKKITLGVPIESRVKSWSSISEKIERINLKLENILELYDLVGMRLILLFKRDLDRCIKLIEDNFEITYQEDTASRLGESQFGYQSYHYVIKLPEAWLKIPTLKDFAEYQAEIQIRTIAQHIWAAASHNLQYKQEDNVPKTVRRSIYRVSALLETVDLEFERVLSEREEYVKELKPEVQDEPLNVDLLKQILDAHIPIEHKGDHETYSMAVRWLSKCGIQKSSQLIDLIKRRLEYAMQKNAMEISGALYSANEFARTDESSRIMLERAERGVFYNHTGLLSVMLVKEYGKDYMKSKIQEIHDERNDLQKK